MGGAEAAQGNPELGGAQEGGPVGDRVEEQEGVGCLQEVLPGPFAVGLHQEKEESGGTVAAGIAPQPADAPSHLHVPRVQQTHSRRLSVHFNLPLTHFICCYTIKKDFILLCKHINHLNTQPKT